MELNNCDKCNIEMSTYELVWITSDDFQPLKGEIPTEKTYEYDALCESCYKSTLTN